MGDPSSVLGSVEVEVKANLDKLTADFARGKVQSQAFAKDVSAATAPGLLNLTKNMEAVSTQSRKFAGDMVTVNRWIKDVDAANERSAGTWQNVSKVIAANAAAVKSMERATAPQVANQRLVAAALRDVEKQYRDGAISVSALSRAQQMAAPYVQKVADEYGNLKSRLDPLHEAHTRFSADMAKINALEAAGTVTTARANAMRMVAAGTFERVEHRVDRLSNSLVGSARAFEHHVRAFRLLYGYIGGEVIGTIAELAMKTLESTAAIGHQAEALGLSTKELQEYRGIAAQVGMSSEDMDSAFQTLGKNIDDLRLGRVGPFSKMLVTMFGKAGAAAEQLKPVNQIFLDMIDKLRRVGDASQRRGAQVVAFGEAGEKMGRLVEGGSEGVNQLRAAVEATGMVLSDEQIQKADATAKKLDQVKMVLGAKIASIVVENAGAISTLADAFSTLISIGLPRLVQTISAFADRMYDLAAGLREVKNASAFVSDLGSGTLPAAHRPSSMIGKVMRWGYNFKEGFGSYDSEGNFTPSSAAPKQPSVTMKLPPARPPDSHGPNIKLDGLLAPKGPKGRHTQEKYDQYESEIAREKEQQLQLEREATGDLLRQNQIDHEIIDLKLVQQVEAIKRQVHNKQLTAKEGQQLIAAAQTTAAMEKEAADRKMRIAAIEKQAQYASEIEQLEQDGLTIARAMARTDDDIKRADLAILDSKQRQVLSELQKEIAIAEQEHDETRVGQLNEELVKLKQNQLAELKQFDVEHLTGIDRFKYDLPHDKPSYDQAIKDMKFQLFNDKLQQAAQFADDVGGAFGKLAGDLASFKNPMEAFKSFIADLAGTFTKNFIEKPVTDWATQHIGIPAAKQGFGKDLAKSGLTAQQFDVALAQATGSLGALEAAAQPTSAGLGAVTTAATPAATSLTTLTTAATAAASALTSAAAAASAGSASDGLSSILGMAGSLSGGAGGGFEGGDVFGGLGLSGGMEDIYGFALGGYTGSGGSSEVKGVVHANEFVMNADAVGQHGVGLLSAMNSGMDPFAPNGGLVGGTPPAGAAGGAQMGDAAAMLMAAAQALLEAADKLSGGGGGGGMLNGLLGIGLGLIAPSIFGKGGGGGGLSGMLGGLFGGGGASAGLSGASAFSGLGLSGGMDSLYGFDAGGFTGLGRDDEVAGLVHKNEWVWDAKTTRRVMPALTMISSGRFPRFTGPGGGPGMGAGGARSLHVHLGDMHIHANDERSARRSGRQALGVIQRGLADFTRKGLNQK